MPFLTTVIPVYNGEEHLPATLRCVAAQTRPPDRARDQTKRKSDTN